MAPEQVKSSKDVDGRADLWSVGAVLFQLVTGKHAFEADGNVQASLAVLTDQPQSLRALAPHAPPELEAVVNRCLTKDVNQRFQTATELADALRPFASDVAKDSLDRIHGAKQAPSLRIALDVAPTSRLAANVREAPTERKIRLADTPRGTRIDPAIVPSARNAAPARGSWLAPMGFGLGAFIVVLGGVLAFGRLARAVPEGASQRSAVIAPSSSARAPAIAVTPDAGKTSAE
jgi:serine/threonine-protein kinase